MQITAGAIFLNNLIMSNFPLHEHSSECSSDETVCTQSRVKQARHIPLNYWRRNRSGAYDIWNDDDDGYDEHLKKRRDFNKLILKMFVMFINCYLPLFRATHSSLHRDVHHLGLHIWLECRTETILNFIVTQLHRDMRCVLFAEMSCWLVWTIFDLTLIDVDRKTNRLVVRKLV